MYLLSQPVQEPEKMTQIIVEALEKTGQRGIINKGWGGLGNCKFLFLVLDSLVYDCIGKFILLAIGILCY